MSTASRTAAGPGAPSPGHLGLASLMALAVGVASYSAYGKHLWGWDFMVFQEAGHAVLHGHPLYGALNRFGMYFLYSPFAGLVLTPLGLLGMRIAFALWNTLSVLVVTYVVWLLLGRVGAVDPGRRARATLLISPLMLVTSSVAENLWLGQINLLLLLLVLADVTGPSRRFQGVGVGIAAGIKLTPLIFILYFVLTRRGRAAATAAGSFAVSILIGFAVLPSDSNAFWIHHLFTDVTRGTPTGSNAYNQSLYAELTRPPFDQGSSVWLYWTLALTTAVCGMAVAVWAHRRGHGDAGVLACATTSLLVSPLSWPAQWVWSIPIFVLWGVRARQRGGRAERAALGAVWLLTTITTYWAVLPFRTYSNHYDAGSRIFQNLYVVGGLTLLAVLALSLARSRTSSSAPRLASAAQVPDPAARR